MEQVHLVTGGAGFLGSNLCRRLLKDPTVIKLFCLDNLQTGRVTSIEPLMTDHRFEFVNQDLLDGFEANVSAIWNLACPASPPAYQKNPIHTLRTSIYGADLMAKLAIKNKAKLFHASTSEVYGDPTVDPQREDYNGNVNPIGARACYDEGKRAAETLLMDLVRIEPLDAKIIRIFNTYGPLMAPNDGRVVSNFIVQALRGADITIYGAGNQTRSFCYVDDMMDAFFGLMNAPGGFVGPMNAGNPVEFTIIELAETVLRLTGSPSKLVFKELPEDDPKQRRPDISLASEICDWAPKVALEQGLTQTIKYFETELQRSSKT